MAIKFATNIPQTLCFPYADFKEVNGAYGQQFAYTVEVDGQRDKLFATPTLHDQLQAAGVSPGDALTITKIEGEGNRKTWLIQQNGKPNGNGSLPSEAEPSEASGVGRSAKEGPASPDFAGMQLLVNHCLQTSWNAWNRLEGGEAAFTTEDVCKLGISLFIECTRRGIRPVPAADAVPASVPSGSAPAAEDDLPF